MKSAVTTRRAIIIAACLMTAVFILARSETIFAQQSGKKAMDHSVYDDWKILDNPLISNDASWISFEINPGKGDGELYLYHTASGGYRCYPRGYGAAFSDASDFLAFRIRPPESLTREARKNKSKEQDMPKDSLGIFLTGRDTLLLYSCVQSFKLPGKGSSWLVFQHYPEKDTLDAGSASVGNHRSRQSGANSGKNSGTTVTVLFPLTGEAFSFPDVISYQVSRKGGLVGLVRQTGDSVEASMVSIFDTSTKTESVLFEGKGVVAQLAVSNSGNRLAFLHNRDTAGVVGFSMHHWAAPAVSVQCIIDTLTGGMPVGWGISRHGTVWFSEDEGKLFFGTAPIPLPEQEDTLLDEEKPGLDVWNWKDGYLQSMQKVRLKQEKERTYLAYYGFAGKRMFQLADESVPEVRTMHKGNGDRALGISTVPYRKLLSWKAERYRDVYLIDLKTGYRSILLREKNGPVILSSGGNYVLWYETADSNWYAHNVSSDELVCLNCGMEVAFYSETFDMPMDPYPYGVAGWTENDRHVLIYDRYDVWKFDPSGKDLPLNLTGGHGRTEHIVYRYRELDPEQQFIPTGRPMVLHGFDEDSKQAGFYLAGLHLRAEPEVLIRGPYSYDSLQKSRDDETLLYRRGSFTDYPDLWISGPDFKKTVKITATNPRSSEYYWGSAELVHWLSFNGDRLDGILYRPEDFDPDRKYPMLVYFYERGSDGLYSHRIPAPSRSTINIPYCVSNGYVVFVPDIVYRTGYPGESAYDAVVSGTMAMVHQHDWIDPGRIGIQGQSWGGYQVAYLVTRTSLFRAAMAGAPVSNMTSAYGGIRWSSGMSRMFQYEQSQSRIGGTLWGMTPLYLENSPLFHVPRIRTPLLIMHNDQDGAVPWSQGMELFLALRRLGKPAWMLVYNEEAHNLNRWPNRKDLSIRMMQFFDHFLKGAPEPLWMKQGIPATEKGKNSGYQLTED